MPTRRQPETLPLTVIGGLDRAVVADVAAGLLLRVPRVALVWADPFTAELGYVQTSVSDSDGRCTERTVELEHGCLSCAMRAGVIRAIRGLARTGRYDTILVHLHPGVEPDAAVAVLHAGLIGTASIDTVISVLPANWLDQLAGDATVGDLGIAVGPDDDRTAATILAAHLDVATALITVDDVATDCPADEYAALSVLAPGAKRIHPPTTLDIDPTLVLNTGGYDPDTRDRFARRGLLDPVLALPRQSCDLRLVRWRSRRPLHPARLHDALDQLADGVIRSSGYLWFATRPELVVGWDSAGDCLQLGPDALWLTASPGCEHAPPTIRESSTAQREQARRDNHPYYGDRANLLAFLGDNLDEDLIRQVLDGCALTDAELAVGVTGWRALDDPFPDWSEAFASEDAEELNQASGETGSQRGAA